MKLLQQIFSIKNEKYHKIIRIFGFKIKIKSKIDKILHQLNNIDEQTALYKIALDQIEELRCQLQGILRLKRHHNDSTTRDKLSLYEHQTNVENLLKNLDNQAKNNCLKILNRLDRLYYANTVLVTDLYSKEELKQIDDCRHFKKKTKYNGKYWENGGYKLPIDFYEPSVFYYRNGCIAIKNKEKINSKTIIDVGSYIADSCLVFREEFPNSPIISFEASKVNYEMGLKTLELNNLEDVIIENLGLGDKEEMLSMSAEGCGGNAIIPLNNINCTKIITLDNYVEKNNIKNIGLIKVDIEGFEQKFLKGAHRTICEQKPTMLVSIYHNYDDFFKIKPMIESWNLGYKFDFFHGALENTAEDEILLICEPKEK